MSMLTCAHQLALGGFNGGMTYFVNMLADISLTRVMRDDGRRDTR